MAQCALGTTKSRADTNLTMHFTHYHFKQQPDRGLRFRHTPLVQPGGNGEREKKKKQAQKSSKKLWLKAMA